MAINTHRSYTEYLVSEPQAEFAIGFKDYNKDDKDVIHVTIDDKDPATLGYTVTRINPTVIKLDPAVPVAVPPHVVRLQRETNIDESFHNFTDGAQWNAKSMDENFEQIRHSQQESRDGFIQLRDEVIPLVDGLEEALKTASEAAEAAQEAADAAEEAAQVSRSADKVFDDSGKTQQELNTAQRPLNKWVSVAKGVIAFIDYYDPAYANVALSTRFPTLAAAQAVYPVATALTQNIDSVCVLQALADLKTKGGGTLLLRGGKELFFSLSDAAAPDGQDGKHCILVTDGVTITTDGAVKGKVNYPANNHGFMLKTQGRGNCEITNVAFNTTGTVGTIGHHIKIVDSKFPKVHYCSFRGTSDAAIGTTLDNNVVLLPENWGNPNYNMFETGTQDIDFQHNQFYDCNKDGAVELMGSERGIVAHNTFYNAKGHGIRCVGNRNLQLVHNIGYNLGKYVADFSAMISAFSGAVTDATNFAKPLYNEGITIAFNRGYNVRDCIHLGIGAEGVVIHDNYFTYRGRAMYILHSGDEIGRWGIKGCTIRDNTFLLSKSLNGTEDGVRYGIVIERQTASDNLPPLGTHVIDDCTFVRNTIEYKDYGFRYGNGTENYRLNDLKAMSNTFLATDIAPTSTTVFGFQLNFLQGGEITDNTFNITNGNELIVYTLYNSPKFNNRRYLNRFNATSTNRIAFTSKNSLLTGQMVVASTTGTLPTGLAVNTPYYIIRLDDTYFRLATSVANAFAGTAITITGNGVGIHYMTLI